MSSSKTTAAQRNERHPINNQPWGKLWNGTVECKHCGLGTANAWIGNLSTAANIPNDNLQAFADVLGTSVNELRVERDKARAQLAAAVANGRSPPQWWLTGPQWWKDLYQNDWTKAPRRWTEKEDNVHFRGGWGDE
jgi:hypothetical protein